MNKDEIKKALECCTTMTRDGVGMCNECPYNKRDKDGYILCGNQNVQNDALNLITEQEKKVDDLKDEIFYLERKIAIRDNAIDDRDKEIEMLEGNQDDIVKQAKINVLNELKTRHDYAIKNMGYPWDISQQIDYMIEELKK